LKRNRRVRAAKSGGSVSHEREVYGGTRKLTFSAVCAAGAVVLLVIGGVSPTGQPGFAAAASLFVCAAAIECGYGFALLVWLASSALAFAVHGVMPQVLLFAGFFGYYPAVKLAAESKLRGAAVWLAKLACAVPGVALLLYLIGLSHPERTGNRVTATLIAAGLLAAFVIFDLGYGKLIMFYRARISRAFRRRK
jgi:hypothetical protein